MTRDAAPLDAAQLGAYFALTEVGSLLGHAVEQHLRVDGEIIARQNPEPAGR